MIALEALSAPAAPDVGRRRSFRQWLALAALAVTFLLVTGGPLFWIRLEAAPLTEGFLEDVWIQSAFVTASALVLALAAPAARLIWADRLVTTVFAVFLVTVLASSLWSITPSRTVEQSAMFLLSSAAALVAGAYLKPFHVLAALWLAMQVGVGASIFAWSRDWPRTVDLTGGFAGIYFNKNSLGPVTVIGAAASLALALAALRRGYWWLVPIAVGAGGVDGFVWTRARSFTSIVAVSFAVVVVVLYILLVPGRLARLRRSAGAVYGAALAAGIVIAIANPSDFTARLGRQRTWESRNLIWGVVFDYAGERSARGWGFMSLWTKPDIIESLVEAGTAPVFDAHSGYFEVLLGVGIVGLVLLFIVLATVVFRVWVAMWRAPSVLSGWAVGVVAYVLAANIPETFIGPNVLPWVLLCVVTGQAVAARQRSRALDEPDDVGDAGDAGDAAGPDDETPRRSAALPAALLDTELNRPFDGPLDFSLESLNGEPADRSDVSTMPGDVLFDDSDDEFGARR